ncbi:hypothetical protein UK23_14920 [Lentzea aerocolonigenes]|uniref:Uncharacterized protein n=1 Tax=Lentzea aerocolonigenes TaxID=68170 RepID=A0A0F0H6K8_LENAE|nr:hypothetical protein [Lentzea aerocolonigenes]KJK49253.1 hypothetical protein UK23_14920 [Lentzea aerocolonigenes]
MSQPRFTPSTFADLGVLTNMAAGLAGPALLRVAGAVVEYFGGSQLRFPPVEVRDGTLHPSVTSPEEIETARRAVPDVYTFEFAMCTRYTVSGYLPLSSGNVVWFRPDGRISSRIPVEVSFERPRGTCAVTNLVVRRGSAQPQLAYGTEVSLAVDVHVGRDPEPDSAYVEITFDWTETSRTTLTQPLARLRIYGSGKVVPDQNFRHAVGGEDTAEVVGALSGRAHLERVTEQLLAEFTELGTTVDLT